MCNILFRMLQEVQALSPNFSAQTKCCAILTSLMCIITINLHIVFSLKRVVGHKLKAIYCSKLLQTSGILSVSLFCGETWLVSAVVIIKSVFPHSCCIAHYPSLPPSLSWRPRDKQAWEWASLLNLMLRAGKNNAAFVLWAFWVCANREELCWSWLLRLSCPFEVQNCCSGWLHSSSHERGRWLE